MIAMLLRQIRVQETLTAALLPVVGSTLRRARGRCGVEHRRQLQPDSDIAIARCSRGLRSRRSLCRLLRRWCSAVADRR